MASPFALRVYELVGRIPFGKVATYGQIAFLAGNPKGARGVGFALRHPPAAKALPCHRVIFRDGSLPDGNVFGGHGIQRGLLEKEGVQFLKDGRVDLSRFLWDGWMEE